MPEISVHFLGSGGWLPSGTRETSCYAVRHSSDLLLLDAGTGLRRLVTQPALLDGVTRLDVAVSHFHLDHVVGLSYLDALGPAIERHIWGAGAWLYGVTTDSVLSRLLLAPYGSAAKEGLFREAHELRAGTESIGPHPVRVRAQTRHSHPSVGFRYADLLAYCTDTAYDPGSAQLAAAASLLIHEAWVVGERGTAYHSSGIEAARVARDAQVGELALSHLDPRQDHALLLAEARAVFPHCDLAGDNRVVRYPAAG